MCISILKLLYKFFGIPWPSTGTETTVGKEGLMKTWTSANHLQSINCNKYFWKLLGSLVLTRLIKANAKNCRTESADRVNSTCERRVGATIKNHCWNSAKTSDVVSIGTQIQRRSEWIYSFKQNANWLINILFTIYYSTAVWVGEKIWKTNKWSASFSIVHRSWRSRLMSSLFKSHVPDTAREEWIRSWSANRIRNR